MILLVDVGNTRVKWLAEGEQAPGLRGALVHGGVPAKELGPRLWAAVPPPTRALLVNVAGPAIEAAMAHWIREMWGIEAEFARSAAADFGIVNAYRTPARMGADRWVAMVGARARVDGACCVIDCGTAVTVDALAGDGRHLGGAIFPGLRLMREALYRDTRQIPPELHTGTDDPALGRDTAACVVAGVLHAVAGGVAHAVRAAETAIGTRTTRLITGGDAALIAAALDSGYQVVPDLIFDGLRRVAVR